MRKGRPRQGEPWRLGWARRVASPQDFIVIIHKILIVLIALTMVMTRYLMDQKSTSRKDRRLVQAWGQDEGRRGFPGPAMSCWDLVDFSPWIPKILYESGWQSWQPFGEGKNSPTNFRQARNYYFTTNASFLREVANLLIQFSIICKKHFFGQRFPKSV